MSGTIEFEKHSIEEDELLKFIQNIAKWLKSITKLFHQ